MLLTHAPAEVEHVFAYAGTALMVLLAYPSRSVWVVSALLAAYSGVMELLQTFSPGRDPGVYGVLSSSAGAMIGGSMAAVLRSRTVAPGS
jgi:VanZ family protein